MNQLKNTFICDHCSKKAYSKLKTTTCRSCRSRLQNEEFIIKYCPVCNVPINESVIGRKILSNKIFCSKTCYHKSRIGSKRPQDVAQKIAIANSGKKFTKERCDAISRAKSFKPTQELLDRLFIMWNKGYVRSNFIMKELGLSQTVYWRLFKEYCRVPQIKFLTEDFSDAEVNLLRELAAQNVYYKTIAKSLNLGHKQTLGILKKFGFSPNTKNPDAWKFIGETSIEKTVYEFLESMDVKFDRQFQIKNFRFDAIVNDKLLIEIHGDYWHCNPKLYPDGPINDVQRGNMRRDFCKRDIATSMGYKRYIIWEMNLKNRREETLNKLKEWIDANSATI